MFTDKCIMSFAFLLAENGFRTKMRQSENKGLREKGNQRGSRNTHCWKAGG